MIKSSQETRNRGELSHLDKDYPTDNIIVNGEKLKDFSPKSGTKQGCCLSLFLFNIVLEDLDNTVRKEKKLYRLKKKIKSSLFTDDMIIYVENPKASIKKS